MRWPTPVKIDVISTEMLLWCLGGFGDADDQRAYRDKHQPLLPWQIREIKKLADLPVTAKTGKVKTFAERAGLSTRVVSVYLHRVRRGIEPRSWRTREMTNGRFRASA